ncbi:MAG: (2Fe-2S)-binding protein [Chloroflexi bacterium]|nr:(2Fe-2S)-binding protein [Chloroflexota bacterium]
MIDGAIPVTLRVNGDDYQLEVEPQWTLADTLRERLGLTGTKMMCEQGECGACTVLINGLPVLSCLTLAIECQGMDIMTIEGVADPQTGELHPIQQAFVERSGMQCGVCTPAMVLTAKALLDENDSPTEGDIRQALAGNICRCGNYKRIVECVQVSAEMMRGGKAHA